VIEVLDSQIDAIQHASDALIASDSILTEKASLLRSCKGVGPKNAQMILARLPESAPSIAAGSPLSSASPRSPAKAAHR
jgi:Holliday junction resolvasome RuvABC DNA-binding subunit